MTYTLSNTCPKNLRKRTLLVQLIIKKCGHMFFWNTVYSKLRLTLKSRLGVTQGHWKRNHWIDHARHNISCVI